MTSTRIAMAGFGAWGQMHCRAIANIDDAEIVAVFCNGDPSTAAAREFLPDVPRFSHYSEMLDAGGYDVVDITVPNHVHARFALQAMQAGANVFLEKPLGITSEECRQIVEFSASSGCLVALNHELRVSNQWGAVRDIIAEQQIGAVRYQHLSLFRHAFRPGSGGWRHDPHQVGSWILEELVHFFDLVVWYAAENGQPFRVRAFGTGTENGLTDNLTTVLEWKDGSVAVLSQCLGGFEHHTLLEVAGTQGGLRTWWSGAMDRTLNPEFEMKLKRGDSDAVTVDIPLSGEVFELEENLRQALAGFRNGFSILSPADARIAIDVCLAAEQSYRSGQSVELHLD